MLRSLLVAWVLLSGVALAQDECIEGERLSQATCDGDICACSAPCESNVNCFEGCCVDGFCTRACVCRGEGEVLYDCVPGYGCGSVAQTQQPLAPASMWGLGLFAVGAISAGRFFRRGGVRSPAAVVALSLALLGATFVGAAAVERSSAGTVKGAVKGTVR